MDKLIKTEKLAEIIEYSGEYKTQYYSGRGMYGKHCLGVSADNLPELIADMAKSFSELYFDPDGSSVDMQAYNDAYFEMCDIIRSTCTDQLGLGIIVYWPKMKIE